MALAATAIALVLGTLAAFAMQRFRFFGRNAYSFLFVLPIALPGIVTGVALQNTFSRTIDLGPSTSASASASTRWSSPTPRSASSSPTTTSSPACAAPTRNLLEASADLGAHGSQTFRYVTFPLMRSAMLAGGILAFALSFDEIIVTTFTAGSGYETLPQWILANISRPNNVPLVNVMATFVMVVSIPLAWLAQRLSD